MARIHSICTFTVASIVALIGVGFGPASPAAAATTTWTGTDGDGLWLTAGNWDNGVPSNSNGAVFNTGVTVNLNSGGSFPQVQTLTINSTDQVFIDSPGGFRNLVFNGFNGATNKIIDINAGDHIIDDEIDINGALTTTTAEISTGASLTVKGDIQAGGGQRGLATVTGGGLLVVEGEFEHAAPTLAITGGTTLRILGGIDVENNSTLEAQVASGGVLDITGTVNGDSGGNGGNFEFTLNDGTLNPSGTVNWFANGDVILTGSSTPGASVIAFTLGSTADKLVIADGTGSAGIGTLFGPAAGNTITLELTDGGDLVPGTFDLIDWSGAAGITLDDLDLADFSVVLPKGFDSLLQFNGAGDILQVVISDSAVIPEPASLVLLSLGGMCLFSRRRSC